MRARRARTQAAEPESYFVSMTDLMIGLLFVFIILLMSFALTYRDAQKRSEAASTDYRIREETLEATNRRLTDNRRTLEHILTQIEQSLDERGIQVQVLPGSGILRLPESILFSTGSAVLTAEGERAVTVLAAAMRPILPCFAEVEPIRLDAAGASDFGLPPRCTTDRHGRLEAVLVEGHTDKRPITGGRFESNWELSTARAIATYERLRTVFPEVAGLRNTGGAQLFGVSGYGSTRPARHGDDASSLSANRRIDLRFVMAAPVGSEGADGPR